MKKLFFIICLTAVALDVSAQNIVTDSLPSSSVSSLMQGKVAGVRVASADGSPLTAPHVSIRGINSLRGNPEPLYVVDGSPLGGTIYQHVAPFHQYSTKGYASASDPLAFLSACDIESIEVLKDASATALYGSLGANGVVVITTKKARTEEPSVRWNSGLSVYEPTHSGYSRTTVGHTHAVSIGADKDRTRYLVSANFRDERYLLPHVGTRQGGLRVSFETKANPVVWFGMNSILSAGKTTSAAAVTDFGSMSQTIAMRDASADAAAWSEDYDDDAVDYRAVTSAWMRLNLFSGFAVNLKLGTDFRHNSRGFWYGNATQFGSSVNGAAAVVTTSLFRYDVTLDVSYNRYIAQKHHLRISAGAVVYGDMDKYGNQNGTDFFTHSLRAKSINIMSGKAVIRQYADNLFSAAGFASVSYSYDGIAGVNVALRADSALKFDGAQMRMFPSASLWWDLRKTVFDGAGAVSSLKLKGGYGESGMGMQVSYDFLGAYIPSFIKDVPKERQAFYSAFNRLHAREWTAGVQLGFARDRFIIEAGYYDRTTSDDIALYCFGAPESEEETALWVRSDRQPVSGHGSRVRNNGVELSLTVVPVLSRNWRWSVDVTAACNVNRIVSVDGQDAGGMSVGGGLIPSMNIAGSPVSAIVGNDGKVLGNPTPLVHGGFGTSLKWKNLDLSLLFDGAAGHDILNLNRMFIDKTEEVTQEYVENGDFLRLARAVLCYDIPVGVKRMDSIRISAGVSNVFTVTGYSGWTPDVNTYPASNFTLGMDYGSCQTARVWTLGVSLSF